MVINVNKVNPRILSGFMELDPEDQILFNEMIDKIALTLVVIGALNWGSIGIFGFDVIGWVFAGQASTVSRIVYTIVGLAGVWAISLLFREREAEREF